MKKKIIVIAMALSICFGLTACVNGNQMDTQENTKWYGMLNTGSCFVYTFQDEETGVWYISTSEGVTPRLNPDGTLYESD